MQCLAHYLFYETLFDNSEPSVHFVMTAFGDWVVKGLDATPASFLSTKNVISLSVYSVIQMLHGHLANQVELEVDQVLAREKQGALIGKKE